jgi:hypothetical protein
MQALMSSLFNVKTLQKKPNQFPPKSAEYIEIRRRNCSAALGDFGAVRRIISLCQVKLIFFKF